MTLLSSISTLLIGSSFIDFTVSKADGCLVVLIKPVITGKEDELEVDPRIAVLHAALTRPVRIKIPAHLDPDAEIEKAIANLAGARQTNVDALREYQEQQQQANLTARTMATSSAKASSKRTEKAAPDAGGEDAPNESATESGTAGEAVGEALSTPPAKAQTLDLF